MNATHFLRGEWLLGKKERGGIRRKAAGGEQEIKRTVRLVGTALRTALTSPLIIAYETGNIGRRTGLAPLTGMKRVAVEEEGRRDDINK